MTALMSVCRPRRIAGFATETMVVSMRIMKNPRTSDQSAGQGRISCCMCLLLLPVEPAGGDALEQSLEPVEVGAQDRALVIQVDPELLRNVALGELIRARVELGRSRTERVPPLGEQAHDVLGGKVVRLAQGEWELRILLR